MNKNKKGLVKEIMIVIILFIVVVVLVSGYWIVSMVGPVIVGEGSAVAHQIQTSISANSPNTSLDNASQIVTSTTINVLGTFEILVYFGLMGMIIGFMLMAYYVRTYPFLAVFWVFMIIFLAFFAMLISNSYQQASTSGNLNTFYTNWGTNNFLMTYLPHIVVFFGVIGGILLFVLASKDPESETQLI